MFALLFAGSAACNVLLSQPIEPREIRKFSSTVEKTDQQWRLHLRNLTKDKNLLFRVRTPGAAADRKISASSEFDDDSFEPSSMFSDNKKMLSNFQHTYTEPGEYTIEIENKGTTVSEFQIASYLYKKVNESNKDVVELRNLLYSLQTTMDTLSSENYYVHLNHDKHIKEARDIRRSMNWLLAFPILTVLVGYLKYVFARMLVKPKGNRFKNLF
ncbi:hypothetical protein PAPHI01_0648 [Pancytospora philotis]|nr:hypothetical protein PAPHI01_0648 [Pancytospora philotis]